MRCLLVWCRESIVKGFDRCGTIEATLQLSLQLTDSEGMINIETGNSNGMPPGFALGLRKWIQLAF